MGLVYCLTAVSMVFCKASSVPKPVVICVSLGIIFGPLDASIKTGTTHCSVTVTVGINDLLAAGKMTL